MKRNQRSLYRRSRWLSVIIGLELLLAACGTSSGNTTVPIVPIAVSPTGVSSSPTASLPTQLPAQSTAAPTEPTIAPTTVTASLLSIACDATTQPTPAQTEGPYYKPNSPERTSLIEQGMSGTRLIVTGYVLTADCKPIANTWLDFWQADDKGAYDNAGYRLRGHLYTDANGHYTLETIVPGEYPGRTQHIHVKVQAPNGPILTTQLYFPNAPDNERDSIFNPALLADVQDTADGKTATFNFVVNTK